MTAGTYALLFTLSEDFEGEVGRLGRIRLTAGRYCYVGSAANGLEARLRRHVSGEKKMRWHIDRLTVRATGFKALASVGGTIPECAVSHAAAESGMIPSIKGFGCSDCKCQTHLFYVSAESEDALSSIPGLGDFPLEPPKYY